MNILLNVLKVNNKHSKKDIESESLVTFLKKGDCHNVFLVFLLKESVQILLLILEEFKQIN